jgi:hypothetical protein
MVGRAPSGRLFVGLEIEEEPRAVLELQRADRSV